MRLVDTELGRDGLEAEVAKLELADPERAEIRLEDESRVELGPVDTAVTESDPEDPVLALWRPEVTEYVELCLTDIRLVDMELEGL